uniref:Uncharacterized protein n=1 Tax=Leersia perrieri TaxID=77586 RepID=A0A0D9VGH4_9ORYZ
MDQPRRRRSTSTAAATRRRLQSLLALAGEYIKYLFMKRGRLLGKVARRSLALILLSPSSGFHGHHSISSSGGKRYLYPAVALAEHEFSCSNSPSPAFLPVKRLRSRLKLRAREASSSCFGCGLSSPPPAVTDQATAEQDYYYEEEVDGWAYGGGMDADVDYRAEEFINMFYEQLRAQL